MNRDRRTAARERAASAALLLLASVGTGGAPAAGAAELAVGGTVQDEGGGALAGAEVTLHAVPPMAERDRLLAAGSPHPEAADRATTGEDGRFRLVAPEEGLWTVVARAPGRVPMEVAGRAMVHAEELGPVRLWPSAELDVLVVDGAGAPVPDAVVEGRGAGRPDRDASRPSREAGSWRPVRRRLAGTDPRGRTRLPRFEGEEVAVWAVASGRVGHATVDAPPDGPVRLVLPDGPAREIQVLGPEREPVAGAAAWVSSPVPVGVTGVDGRLVVPAPGEGGEGPFRVHVHGADGLLGEAEIEPREQGGGDADGAEPLRIHLEEPVTVQGRVLAAGRREGIAGALVWPYSQVAAFTRTDRTGSFRLSMHPSWLDSGIQVAAPGFVETRSEVTDGSAPGSEEVTVLLQPAAALEGRVVDATGHPVAGAAVRGLREDRMGPRREAALGRSDAQGRFRIGGLTREAVHVVQASREGYAPAVERVAPIPPDSRSARSAASAGSGAPAAFPEVRLVLHPQRRLRGRAVNEHGEPVPGARVLALTAALSGQGWPLPPGGLAETETGADGRFELDDMAPGRLSLLVSAPEYAPAWERGLELPEEGGTTDLGDLVLEPEVFVEGRVVDPAGDPVEDASIQSWPQGGSRRLPGDLVPGSPQADRELTTGPDGRFRFGALAPGEVVRLQISRDGYVGTRVEGLRAPTEEPVSIVLRPAAAVAGMVVDESGRPVAGARVRPSWRAGRRPGGHVTPSETDEHGAFELTGLAPGAVVLTAEAPGFQESGPVHLELAPGERRERVEIVLSEGVEVTGRVLDPEGLPVARADVQVLQPRGQGMAYRSEHTITGPDGRFTLDTLPTGRITIQARKEGFGAGSEEIDLGPAGASVELYLERGVEVRGRVLEADGSPGAGRKLRIDPHRTLFGARKSAIAASDGSFAFRGISAGEYRLSVLEDHSVLWSSPEPVVVEGAPVTGLEVRLAAGATLEGRILGLDRRELRRSSVSGSLMARWQNARRSGRVRQDGTYRIEDLTPGEWRITAESPVSGRQARGRVEIEEGQTSATLDLEFREGFTVQGVVERAGRPLPGAVVQMYGQDYRGGQVTTGFEGRFRFQGVPRGEHRLTARDSQSGASLSRAVQVDGDRDLRLELEGYRLRGAVYAADGTGPVAEASVRLHRQEAPGDPPGTSLIPSRTLTGHDGSFLLDGVATGRWRVLVEKPGYASHAGEVEIARGDVEMAPVYLEPAGELEILARLADGATPSHLRVVTMGNEARMQGMRTVGAVEPGRFVLDTVPPGSWELLVWAPEATFVRVAVEVPGVATVTFPEPGTLEVAVPELAAGGGRAELRLLDEAGRNPLAAVGSSRFPLGGGRTRLPGLPPGTWTVVVSTADGRQWTGTAAVTAGQTTRLVLE